VRYPNVIDHHLATGAMRDLYFPGSATVVRPDLWGDPTYGGTAYLSTSDHYPVETDYLLGVVPSPTDAGTDAGTGG
jgi:hypothetical protein